MKNYKLYILNALLALGSNSLVSAQPPPPPPLGGPGAPNGFDLPINDHLIPILLVSLFFGSYMIYRYNQKQKNPV